VDQSTAENFLESIFDGHLTGRGFGSNFDFLVFDDDLFFVRHAM
jgi:hypothetical protein